MKKWIVFIMGTALSLLLVGCAVPQTDNESSDSNDVVNTSTQTTTSQVTTTTTSAATESQAADTQSVEAYVASMQDEIEALVGSMMGDDMGLQILARGNSLVYQYQYSIDLGDTDVAKQVLEQALDMQDATFESVFDSLKAEVPSAESVIIEYLDKDGNLLLSKEYK